MNVVAYSGKSYVIDLEDGRGQVLDLEHDRLFEPVALVSLLARAGWEAFTADQEPILARMRVLAFDDPYVTFAASSGTQSRPAEVVWSRHAPSMN